MRWTSEKIGIIEGVLLEYSQISTEKKLIIVTWKYLFYPDNVNGTNIRYLFCLSSINEKYSI